ncbi:hypothetical protein ACYCGP_18250 [Stutzerimonas nitrititolerans]
MNNQGGISMLDLDKRLAKVEADHKQLLEMFVSQKAGMAAAMAAISCALRETPGFDAEMFRKILTATLQGWPLAGIPDNEATETAFAAPLRFLLQEHEATRGTFRSSKN